MKIDRNLVRTFGKGPISGSVLSGIVALARKMNVQIVAEGIEEPEELEKLRAEGCDQGQGFLFGRPLAADAISTMMTPSGVLPGFQPAAEPPPQGPGPTEEIAGKTAGEVLSPPALTAEAPPIVEVRSEAPPVDGNPSFEEAPPQEVLAEEEPPAESATEGVPPAEVPPAEPVSIDDALLLLEIPMAGEGGGDGGPATQPGVVAADAGRPAEDLKRMSSFARSAMTARARRRRVRTALLAAVLVISTGHLLRDRIPRWTGPAAETETAAAGAAAVPEVEPVAEPVAEPATWPPAAAAAVPPAADPPPSATRAADPTPELRELAERWARAWSEQRVDDYLRCYSRGFRPPDGASRGDWEALRQTRIRQPDWIEVTLRAIEVEPLGAARARVRFDQGYRTATYQDEVRKTLELVREGSAWKILEERVEE